MELFPGEMLEAARAHAIETADDAQDFIERIFPCNTGALVAFTRLRESGSDLYAQIVNSKGESLGCYSLTKPRCCLRLLEHPTADIAALIRIWQARIDVPGGGE